MCRICGYDMVTLLNMVICVLILAAGSRIYYRTKNKTPFHIGVAFGLFAVAHLIRLLGAQNSFAGTTTLINIFGYLIVLFSLYEISGKKK